MDNIITIEQVKEALPSGLRVVVTDELVTKLNSLQTEDANTAKTIRENFFSYLKVLQEGKFKLEDYLTAVKYVSYKVMGYNNRESYIKTFPKRYKTYLASNLPMKDIDSLIASYNRGKLVNLILEQTLIPTWILNQDIYQEAINTQAELMRNAKSERVRMQAADSILTHLARPEAAKDAQINLNVNAGDAIKELKQTLISLAQKQQELISQGITAKEIAEQRIIDGEYREEIS